MIIYNIMYQMILFIFSICVKNKVIVYTLKFTFYVSLSSFDIVFILNSIHI